MNGYWLDGRQCIAGTERGLEEALQVVFQDLLRLYEAGSYAAVYDGGRPHDRYESSFGWLVAGTRGCVNEDILCTRCAASLWGVDVKVDGVGCSFVGNDKRFICTPGLEKGRRSLA